ncbi:class I SAM-dependent methyltransferase [Kineosporia mesophila]|uniref:Class I SAM-dependent methyltransferase n=1 Tax=Kineosporia mesophila TaxID=566012 RepID=A0ABP6ZNJ1_9ACTN|nr:class I SAM-dependent methyltransferase [Kineosporia mesophila]MCD5353668.1 class I SAM-dependent methyltransferase [Kineosporia mesophila]
MVEPRIEQYAEAQTSEESALLAQVAADTRDFVADAFMMSGSTQGQFLACLVHLGQPRNILEIGTFTGYSALAMAEAMPGDGRITTCEIDPDTARIAAQHFASSPRGQQIDLRVGPALPVVDELPGPFDLVFIDAEKSGYSSYFEAVVPKLAPHGLIVVDNTLHGGLDPQDDEDQVNMLAVHAFNATVRRDRRVEQIVLTVRDGISLIRLKAQP